MCVNCIQGDNIKPSVVWNLHTWKVTNFSFLETFPRSARVRKQDSGLDHYSIIAVRTLNNNNTAKAKQNYLCEKYR